MTALPRRPLGEVLSLSVDEEAVRGTDTYNIAGVYGFGRGLFRRGPIRGDETSYPKLNRLHRDRLVMSRLKAFEGALTVIPSEFDGWFLSPEFPTFQVDANNADVRYLAHICAWPDFWQLLGANSKGLGARKERVSASRLLSIEVPLPDLDEQRRIATRLDSALAKVDRVEELRAQMRRFQQAFSQSLTSASTASGAENVRIGEILRSARIPIEIDPGAPYSALGMRSFGKGTIRYPAAAGEQLSKLRYFRFPSGALVLSNIKAWEGAIGVTAEKDTICVASNRFLFYLPRDERTNISYLRHYLLSKRGLGQVSACSPGSADRNRTLSIKAFEALEIPLPERSVQDRVATNLDSLGERLDQAHGTDTLSALRPSLLNAAFNGKL